ncbi:glycosyltransferase family 2 protein [Colwellia piezophila]|uniref:glycosyltransferase family 2 protein n=1 Tax=Colwellia piezophila TaxID=211668 RepID=UPI00036CAAC3|nr:glycosyltransferase family 2 protein [Colwellia piezophila]
MKYCFIIPNYNHTHQLEDVLLRLSAYELPIIMINDGSEASAKQLFETLVDKVPLLTLIHLSENQGKGGAVQRGLRHAFQLGFEYGIQVDADGQHNLADVPLLIDLSEKHPGALISGKPVYDDSIPKIRYFARFITHFWVYIETLSWQLKDSMCGFRVYPLAPSITLMDNVNIGKRMDFDTEIMVRLYWQGLDVKFLPTRVIYPEFGVSHFRAIEDNVRISWMHTRLFFGMLLRSPKLILRHFS